MRPSYFSTLFFEPLVRCDFIRRRLFIITHNSRRRVVPFCSVSSRPVVRLRPTSPSTVVALGVSWTLYRLQVELIDGWRGSGRGTARGARRNNSSLSCALLLRTLLKTTPRRRHNRLVDLRCARHAYYVVVLHNATWCDSDVKRHQIVYMQNCTSTNLETETK